jgi:diguanylate cyclase (GGDEF)-like protein/PAS domain S-box-containing protein
LGQIGKPRVGLGRVIVSCLLIAAVANFALVLVTRAIDNRRLDQLRIAKLHTDCFRLLSIADGSNSKNFRITKKAIDDSAATLAGQGDDKETKAFAKAYKSFSTAAGRKGATAAAIRPAFVRLEKAMNDLEADVRSQAGNLTLLARASTSLLFLGAGLVAAVFFMRHQKRLLTLAASEAMQQSADSSERRFRSLVRNNADVIAVADEDGKLKLVSEASLRLWGLRPDDLVGDSVFRYTHAEDSMLLVSALHEVASHSESHAELEVRVQNGPDQFRPFHVHLSNLMDDPDVSGILLTFHDLTERKRLEEELTYNAFHDRLTGLPNRALFMDRLAHRLKLEGRDPSLCGVLFIDLDNFKVINDSLGHATGDALLVAVAERLQTELRQSDTIARLGGDEFTVLLASLESVDEAVGIAERLISVLERAFVVGNSEMFVSMSIGIAMSCDGQYDASRILRNADTAMYEAKAQGKNGFAIYDGRMSAQAVERLELEWDLRNAIDQKQLYLLFQPIVDIATGKLKEVETLIRWQHPTRGTISPVTFIPIAEESGLICSIGLWVLREACYQLHRWGDKHRDLVIGLNVSARQFLQPDFVLQVRQMLHELRVEPSRIKLEITETSMLHDLDRIRIVLEQLRELGVRIAIDDFGTGYSSISYLSRLPVDTLKIDRSFIIPLGEDARTDGVVRAMIAMARTLGLQVTSEGIETLQQLQILKELGCDFGQGYLFSRPVSADEIAARLLGMPSSDEPAIAL